MKSADGGLVWMVESTGQVGRYIPPDRAAVVEERWAEDERRREAATRSRPVVGGITEDDLRRTMSQPSAYQRQMAADRTAVRAIEEREHQNMLRAEAGAMRKAAGLPLPGDEP